MTSTILKQSRFFAGATLLCVSAFAQSALAQAPTEASIAKLIEVIHLDQTMNQMLSRNDAVIGSMAQSIQLPEDLSAETAAQAKQIIIKYATKASSALNTPEFRQTMIDGYVKVAQEKLTQAEVDAQISFYDTPVGQSIIKKQPEVYQLYMQNIMPVITQKTEAETELHMSQMKKELKALLDDKELDD